MLLFSQMMFLDAPTSRQNLKMLSLRISALFPNITMRLHAKQVEECGSLLPPMELLLQNASNLNPARIIILVLCPLPWLPIIGLFQQPQVTTFCEFATM